MGLPRTPVEVLNAWFSLPHKDHRDDPEVGRLFREAYQSAGDGTLDHWAGTAEGRLALILLLDQVPRHLFRDRPRQYHTDERARTRASYFFHTGFPDDFAAREVFYAALPYLHAEDLAKQKRVNPIMHRVARRIPALEFMGRVADRYLETIRRFGRFPHRNRILGRSSTAAERRFLRETEASWGSAGESK